MRKTQNTKQGFTLIETLVAIAILLIALTAPLTLASRSISYTSMARDQIIASYLAFDAMEATLARKQSNVSAGEEWDSGLSCPSGSCRIDTVSNNVTDLELSSCVLNNSSSGSTCYLRFDESTELYQHTGGEISRFQRYVTTEDTAEDEKRINVHVRYRVGLLERDIVLSMYIYNSQ